VTLNHRVHAVEDSPRTIQGDCIRREAWEGCINPVDAIRLTIYTWLLNNYTALMHYLKERG